MARMARIAVRSGSFRRSVAGRIRLNHAVWANASELTRTAAPNRQAGGHWFEPSTAHSREQARPSRLAGSNRDRTARRPPGFARRQVREARRCWREPSRHREHSRKQRRSLMLSRQCHDPELATCSCEIFQRRRLRIASRRARSVEGAVSVGDDVPEHAAHVRPVDVGRGSSSRSRCRPMCGCSGSRRRRSRSVIGGCAGSRVSSSRAGCRTSASSARTVG